jgi:hyperosmotically inducible protein
MKNLLGLLIGGFLVVGAVSCSEPPSRTSADAPDSTKENVNAPTKEASQTTQSDATNDTRKRQIESDTRAREERNNVTGGDADRADADRE